MMYFTRAWIPFSSCYAVSLFSKSGYHASYELSNRGCISRFVYVSPNARGLSGMIGTIDIKKWDI